MTTRDPRARRVLPLQWSTGMASVGDGAFRVSAPLIAASLTADPRAVSLVSVASYAAWFTGLFAGALTDRWPRRTTLIRTELVRAACLLALVVLVLLGQASVPLVVVMAFLMTTGTVFFDSSGQAILPAIVGRDIDLLSRQNGLLYAAETTGRSFAGIPLGSATFALGAAAPFALGSIAYLCSSLTLRGLPRDADASPGVRHGSLAGEIRTGFAHLGRDRPLLAMSLSTAAFNFADAVAMAVFVLYARFVLGVPDWAYGLLLVCVALGSVAGGMLSGRLGGFHWNTVVLVAAAVQSAGWVVIVTTRSPWLTGVTLAVMGTSASAATVSVVSNRQARVPDRLLGRVVAGFRVVGNGSAIAGAAAGGLIAATFGLVAAPWAAAGFLFVATLPLCWFAGRRRQARHPGGDPPSCTAVESTRVDRWLWAVRLTKTRPDAAAACRGGHVRVNDRPAKPATTVSPGDEVRARVGDTTRVLEVVRVIQKRVGATDAATCFIDRTPAPPPEAAIPVARRDRGAGRPTKRDRRLLDRFRTGGS